MRFSYIFKRGIYRFIILIIIDLFFFYIVLSGTAKIWFHYLPFLTFLLYGALFVFVAITFLEIKAFTKGAEGEQKIWRILKGLPQGYYTLSDFSNGKKGNIDLVVVGPTGVWTIEVKNYWGGEIKQINEVLCRNGIPFKKDFLKQAYAESKSLEEYLQQSFKVLLPVTPVLVFANKFTKLRFGKYPVNGVYVIGTSWLLDIIQNRQTILTPDQCIKIRDEIKKYTSII